MPKAKCPICGEDVELPEDVIPGEVVEHDCGASLEVVSEGGSVGLRLLEDVSEDWGE